jgi:hypothetical protein
MDEIDTVKNEAEAIKDKLNKQKEEIDLLIKKAKEQGEDLSPVLIADFEQAKQSVAEINKRADNINAKVEKIKQKTKPSGKKPMKNGRRVLLSTLKYLGALALASVLMGLGVVGIETEQYGWALVIGVLIFIVTMAVFAFWTIRGIIRWIARTAKAA